MLRIVLRLPHKGSNRVFFFLKDPPTPEFYPLPLPAPLPSPPPFAPPAAPPPLSSPLSSAERSFALLVQSVTDYAIYMLDPEGRIVSWNLGAKRIKGYEEEEDRKSTRLNSSHLVISYAVFCLK